MAEHKGYQTKGRGGGEIQWWWKQHWQVGLRKWRTPSFSPTGGVDERQEEEAVAQRHDSKVVAWRRRRRAEERSQF